MKLKKMSRHRNVRSMNYSDEYDGYDDVYGTSVEDDYCVSPSAEQFLFDRNKQHNISSYITEDDIAEEDETQDDTLLPSSYKRPELPVLEATKLESCIEMIKNVVGDSIPESTMTQTIIEHNFNSETALDALLATTSPTLTSSEKTTNKIEEELPQGRSVPTFDALPDMIASHVSSGTVIPKFKFNKRINRSENMLDEKKLGGESRTIRANELTDNNSGVKTRFPIPGSVCNSDNKTPPIPSHSNTSIQQFGTLADLTAHHLKKSSSSGGISSPVIGSPNAGFVIPRLWSRNDSIAPSPTIQFNESLGNSVLKKRGDLDRIPSSLNDSLCEMHISSNLNEIQEKGDKIKSEVPEASFSNTRTPSPDDWVIDLSSALSETFSKVRTTSQKSNSNLSDDLSQDISRLDIYLNTKTPEVMEAGSLNAFFDCNLNLSNLKHIKLSYSKEVVSLFGKILCRRWKTRKPYVKTKSSVEVVKRFDFSIPSPDDKILVHLKKRL